MVILFRLLLPQQLRWVFSARRNAHDSSEFQVGGTSDLIGKGYRQFRPDTRPTWFIGDI